MVVFTLTIIRHGETRYNKEKILQGQGIDEPLSETGFKQANAAGIFLSNVRFTHVFASDLIRAKQTVASILSKSHFCKEAAVKYDARLRERKYGVAEGKPLSDLKFMAKVSGEQCPYFTPAGGETLDEIKARGKDFFEYLCYLVAHEACLEKQTCPVAEESCFTSLTNYRDGLEDHADSDGTAEMLDASILVVSHGAFMRSWIDYLVSDLGCTLPSTLTKTELFSVSPNTGISRFIIKLDMREGIKPRIHCIYLNRVDHLHDKTADRI